MPSRQRGVFALSTPNLAHGRHTDLDRWQGFQISSEHLYFFGYESLLRCGNLASFNLCAWYSGGSGGVPAKGNPLRAFAKSVLGSTGFLPLVQRLRSSRRRPSAADYYVPGGHGHNLLMVLCKSHTPGPGGSRAAKALELVS